MIIAVAGLKGGVGKSSTSLHLAGEAQRRGKRVLVVDADVQRTAIMWADLALEAGRSVPTVIGMSTNLHKQLPALASQQDVTIIDLPPRADVLTRAALMTADVVVCPCAPSPTDVWATRGTVDLLEQAQALRPELRARLLLNRVQPRQRLSAGVRDVLATLGVPILEATLGFRTAYAEALAGGETVSTFAPGSAADVEVRALLDEIEGAAT